MSPDSPQLVPKRGVRHPQIAGDLHDPLPTATRSSLTVDDRTQHQSPKERPSRARRSTSLLARAIESETVSQCNCAVSISVIHGHEVNLCGNSPDATWSDSLNTFDVEGLGEPGLGIRAKDLDMVVGAIHLLSVPIFHAEAVQETPVPHVNRPLAVAWLGLVYVPPPAVTTDLMLPR